MKQIMNVYWLVLEGCLVWEFSLFNQPANIPDLNLNDLALLVSSKVQYWKDPAHSSIGGIIAKIWLSFIQIFREQSWAVVSWLYRVEMNQSITHDGRNDFRLGHIGKENKERLIRLGKLPLNLDVHEQVLQTGMLKENDQNGGNCTF
jgi:hypothetical protein